ncbi:MAG: flavodoxin family protein [Proteobacteria bacterium]|nr:flavodoxin family protein [Pseudomonadota bacterium]MBU1386507.1 flavodoxin family protein [Pseudomonadota bacterium]MBU1544618.1 flavodoxin family protein [Pseudomonadota bacterium]MBU2430011.1 flavodoxin family protein [Pseudomonadota bacterium]MBU2481403.1 flavodoxin family protein [Pseudomonadota bacterium]
MNILGVHGSPRIKGNSDYLMSCFMKEMEILGHKTQVLHAAKLKINHCIGCGHCETKGVCIFDDDFTTQFLPALHKADIFVVSSPVYFYGFPSALKTLIDRIQVVWSRKYRLKTDDYRGRVRKGVLLGVAATKGKDLFEGLELTARYFFDAADIQYETGLFYRGIDEKGQIVTHPLVHEEIQKLAHRL